MNEVTEEREGEGAERSTVSSEYEHEPEPELEYEYEPELEPELELKPGPGRRFANVLDFDERSIGGRELEASESKWRRSVGGIGK